MEAHIDDVSLGTITQEYHVLVSAATLHPRRSEVNSGQCTLIQSDSAHFRTFTYGKATQMFTRTVPVYYGHAGFNSGVRCG